MVQWWLALWYSHFGPLYPKKLREKQNCVVRDTSGNIVLLNRRPTGQTPLAVLIGRNLAAWPNEPWRKIIYNFLNILLERTY